MTETVTDIPNPVLEKENRLKSLISGYGSMAVAYSGGVDSTYLAAVAHEVLGDRAELVIADSPSIPRSELAAAKALARERGWNLAIIKTNEFEREDYLKNDPLRCYHCKTELRPRQGRGRHGLRRHRGRRPRPDPRRPPGRPGARRGRAAPGSRAVQRRNPPAKPLPRPAHRR